MSCASCNRSGTYPNAVCQSCIELYKINKQVPPGFKPQYVVEAEQRQREQMAIEQAAHRKQMEEQRRIEIDMEKIMGYAGFDIDKMYRQMQMGGRFRGSGPKQADFSGKPIKQLIIKIV
jgi:hypothetical protein